MDGKPDKSKFSLELNPKRKSPASGLPDLNGVVTPLSTGAFTPCGFTSEDIQKIGVATPDMENLILNLNSAAGINATPTPSLLTNKSISTDKEEFCKELLLSMEANIKSKRDSLSQNLFPKVLEIRELPNESASFNSELVLQVGQQAENQVQNTSASSISFQPTVTRNSLSTNGSSSSLPPPLRSDSSIVKLSSSANEILHNHSSSGNSLLSNAHHHIITSFPIAIVNPQPFVVGSRKSAGVSGTGISVANSQLSSAAAITNNFLRQTAAPKLTHSVPPITSGSSNDHSTRSRVQNTSSSCGGGGSYTGGGRSCSSSDNIQTSLHVTQLAVELEPDVDRKERKRLRNRIAATKCRQKKIEKIQSFEDQIRDLKRKYNDLSQQKTSLKEKTSLLKENVLFHAKKGCNVIIAPLALVD